MDKIETAISKARKVADTIERAGNSVEYTGPIREVSSLLEKAMRLLNEARPFVADSGDDEDPDASMSARDVVTEIDNLFSDQ